MMRLSLFLVFVIAVFQIAQAQSQSASSKSYGIILSGGANEESNYYRYYNSTVNVHKAFVQSGIDKNDIYTYFASGSAKSTDTKNAGVRMRDYEQGKPGIAFSAASSFKKENINVNGAATSEDLKKAFVSIAAKAKPGDVVSLFVTDHGSSKGEVVMWGLEPKPESEKTEKDLAFEKETDQRVMRSKKLNVEQLKEMIKLLPPGVTVQIANNICYGGKLVELTDADLNVCVVSQVDAAHESRSEMNSSPFADTYAAHLGKKSFSESYRAARDADLNGNIGSMNSLDYYVAKEMMKIKTSKKVCAQLNSTGTAKAAQDVSQPLAAEAEVLAVKAQYEQAQNKLKALKVKQASYLENEYRVAKNELTRQHEKIARLKAGPEKDLAYGDYNKKVDALQDMKIAHEVKIKNLTEQINNYQKQINFLPAASPEQLEKYRKIKKCMETTI